VRGEDRPCVRVFAIQLPRFKRLGLLILNNREDTAVLRKFIIAMVKVLWVPALLLLLLLVPSSSAAVPSSLAWSTIDAIQRTWFAILD
jgi:hypothetical protein